MEIETTHAGFAALELSAETLASLEGKGYKAPTDVQSEAIPRALAGKDLVVQSLNQQINQARQRVSSIDGQLSQLSSQSASPAQLDKVRGEQTAAANSLSNLQQAAATNQTTTYQYDELGNLVGVTLPDGTQIGYLIATMVLGSTFLVVKGIEYPHKWVDHLMPGPSFDIAAFGGEGPHARIFYSFYFVMTGVHAFHMIVGLGLMAWITRRAARGDFVPVHHTALEMTGLYWHFVDVVWIFLFPLLYLIGRHG
jgi:hypothetical protein